MSRLLGALGFVPSIWIVGLYVGNLLGLHSGGRIDAADALMFFGLAVLAVLFLLPVLEHALVRRSRSPLVRIVKYAIVIVASGLLVIAGSAGLLIVDVVADRMRNVLFAGALAVWLLYLALAIFPGWYARELDRRAGSEQRGLTRTASHIKARLSFEAHNHGPPLIQPVSVPQTDTGRRLFLALLLIVLAGFGVSLYGTHFASFVPNFDFVTSMEDNALIAGVGVAQLAIVLILIARRPPGRLLTRSKAILAIAWALILGGATASMMGTPLARGLGAVLPGETTAAQLSVFPVGPTPEEGSFGCADALEIRPLDWPDSRDMKLCGVPQEVRAAATPGKAISVSGQRNPYGLDVERVRLLP